MRRGAEKACLATVSALRLLHHQFGIGANRLADHLDRGSAVQHLSFGLDPSALKGSDQRIQSLDLSGLDLS
jgi:hypothetical protein